MVALLRKQAEHDLFCRALMKSQPGVMRPRGPEHIKTRFLCSGSVCIAAVSSTWQLLQPALDLPTSSIPPLASLAPSQPSRRPLHSRQLSQECKGRLGDLHQGIMKLPCGVTSFSKGNLERTAVVLLHVRLAAKKGSENPYTCTKV